MKMFKIGQLVVHGTAGVCEVMNIGTPEAYCGSTPKLYYTLVSLHDSSKIVYTPVDNQKVYLRAAMTREECESFIDSLDTVTAKKGWVTRNIMEEFRADASAYHARACAEWIKGLYVLQKEKYVRGKKQLTGTEKNCLRTAEGYLYEELADVLGIRTEEAKEIVLTKLGVK